MTTPTELQLPENSCAYERYDPKTLRPLNEETFVRLQELGWSDRDFQGRSVLDIGCNSGLLTVYALRLGATRVTACDVQVPLVDFVKQVVQLKNLPVNVALIGFKELNPAQMKHDVVLFMEVLHWVVSQGLDLRGVIRKLAELTGETLFIEFPWSVDEPSIQKQTKLTSATYSSDAVLDELTRYFTDVKVVRFMRYFGFKSGSQRVLIAAKGKRPEADILTQMTEVYSLDFGLTRGRNESYLLTSPRGPLVAKRLAQEATLFRVSEQLCTRLFDEIRRHGPQTVLLPEKINGSYLLSSPGGKRWMVLPYVGHLPSAGAPKAAPSDLASLTELFLAVRRDLRPVSSAVVAELREQRAFPRFDALGSPEALWATNPGELSALKEGLHDALRLLPGADSHAYDAVCHGDLQTGNFVLGQNGETKVVDLDNFCVAPIFADGLLGLIWRGASVETLRSFCDRLRPEEARPVQASDVAVAVANGVAWFTAVRSRNSDPVIQEQIARLHDGLSAALQLLKSL